MAKPKNMRNHDHSLKRARNLVAFFFSAMATPVLATPETYSQMNSPVWTDGTEVVQGISADQLFFMGIHRIQLLFMVCLPILIVFFVSNRFGGRGNASPDIDFDSLPAVEVKPATEVRSEKRKTSKVAPKLTNNAEGLPVDPEAAGCTEAELKAWSKGQEDFAKGKSFGANLTDEEKNLYRDCHVKMSSFAKKRKPSVARRVATRALSFTSGAAKRFTYGAAKRVAKGGHKVATRLGRGPRRSRTQSPVEVLRIAVESGDEQANNPTAVDVEAGELRAEETSAPRLEAEVAKINFPNLKLALGQTVLLTPVSGVEFARTERKNQDGQETHCLQIKITKAFTDKGGDLMKHHILNGAPKIFGFTKIFPYSVGGLLKLARKEAKKYENFETKYTSPSEGDEILLFLPPGLELEKTEVPGRLNVKIPSAGEKLDETGKNWMTEKNWDAVFLQVNRRGVETAAANNAEAKPETENNDNTITEVDEGANPKTGQGKSGARSKGKYFFDRLSPRSFLKKNVGAVL